MWSSHCSTIVIVIISSSICGINISRSSSSIPVEKSPQWTERHRGHHRSAVHIINIQRGFHTTDHSLQLRPVWLRAWSVLLDGCPSLRHPLLVRSLLLCPYEGRGERSEGDQLSSRSSWPWSSAEPTLGDETWSLRRQILSRPWRCVGTSVVDCCPSESQLETVLIMSRRTGATTDTWDYYYPIIISSRCHFKL